MRERAREREREREKERERESARERARELERERESERQSDRQTVSGKEKEHAQDHTCVQEAGFIAKNEAGFIQDSCRI